MERIWKAVTHGVAVILMAAFTGGVAVAQSQPKASQDVVARAAQALGGADKIRAVRNITAHGYAQYAYMFGAGRITGAPEAPEKYIAANELSRVYDLEHDRYEARERRNMLFPFLGRGMHEWNETVQVLDGDFAYDQQGDKAVRVPNMSDGALWLDGVHVRREWMNTNPIVLVRSMMDPATKLSAPRRVDGTPVVDVVLKTGDKISVAFRADDGLPAWVRWSARHTNFGQLDLTTTYSGWADATGNSGLLLPLGSVTRLSYRNVDYFKLYIDGYEINSNIRDLTAPAGARALPEPASYAVPKITSRQIGKGVWRVDQNGTAIIEFKDHLVVYELGASVDTAKAILAHARGLAPGKPVTQYIASHNHVDHVMGIRQAVAEGVTVIQRKNSEGSFRAMAEHPAPDYPDDQQRLKKPFKFVTVGDHLRLSDESQTIDIYAVPQNAHMADAIVVYIPSEKLLIEGDLISAAVDLNNWVDGFRDVIAKYSLDVERVAPVHGGPLQLPGANGQPYVTRAFTEEFIKEGVERARKYCADWIAKGVRHPGCPVQSKYY